MIRSARLRSLAKVNLDLRVLAKRPDGFHELRTVFQTISLADTLDVEFEPTRRTQVTLDDSNAIPDNLVIRAAEAALDAMKVRARVHFRLRKSIPMGGGLGGGSSNAAAVLLSLPVLAGKYIEWNELCSIARVLGSDVPFFLTGGASLGVDRGTETYPLADLKAESLLLVAPPIGVPTAEAYQALQAGLTSPAMSPKINDFQLFVRTLVDTRSARAASALSANDFEAAVFRKHPLLKTMWGKLRKVENGARMTGSGSTLFAVFPSRRERDLARDVLGRDRVFQASRLLPAEVVSGRSYRRLWRKQLGEHTSPDDLLWPLRSRYAR